MFEVEGEAGVCETQCVEAVVPLCRVEGQLAVADLGVRRIVFTLSQTDTVHIAALAHRISSHLISTELDSGLQLSSSVQIRYESYDTI